MMTSTNIFEKHRQKERNKLAKDGLIGKDMIQSAYDTAIFQASRHLYFAYVLSSTDETLEQLSDKILNASRKTILGIIENEEGEKKWKNMILIRLFLLETKF